MPGIYVQDSSMGPTLANAIAGIASNYSPKTRAEAELLRQQTEQENWKNRLSSTTVPATEQEIGAAAQLPTALGAELGRYVPAGGPNPTLSQGGPGAVYHGETNVDPAARGVVDTQGAGIIGRLLAGRAAQGANIDELMGGINEVQNARRPGAGYRTQTELAKARGMPVTLTPGQTYFPDPGAAMRAGQPAAGQPPVAGQPGQPGVGQPPAPTSLSGGSVYSQEATQIAARSDQETFRKVDEGAAAGHQGLQRLDKIQQLYNVLIQNTDASGRISAAVQDAIRQRTGLTFTDKAAAMAEISKQINEIMASLRGPMGIQRLAGPEISLLQQTLPNGLMDPRTFNDLVNAMKASLTQQVQAGDVARNTYLANPSQESAQAGRVQMNQVYATDPFDEVRKGHPTLFGGGPAQPDVGGGKPLEPADRAEAQRLISSGQPRDAVIKHLRDNGYNTEGL